MKQSPGMNYEDAAKILGLKKGETVENYRKAFEEVRKHMARLRDEADSSEKRETYQKELSRFEEALAVATHHGPKKSRVVATFMTVLIVGGAIAAAAILVPRYYQKEQARQEAEKILPAGNAAIELKDWVEAERIFKEILTKYPESEAAKAGLAKIEEAEAVERGMKVQFLLGQAQSSMDERNWKVAEDKIAEALEMEPGNEQILAFQERMAEGKRVDGIERLEEEIEQARREQDWRVMVDKIEQLYKKDPQNPELANFEKARKQAEVALAGYADQAKRLYEQALSLDKGDFNEEALELLREAQRLSPSDEAADLYRKMSSYAQIVRVPQDVKTIAEALKKARAGDKIVLGQGSFEESLHITSGVTIEGTKGKTVLLGQAGEGSAIVITSTEQPARFVGLTFTQNGINSSEERFPVVLIKGGKAVLEDCEVSFGSGHGVAVLEGGEVQMIGSEVRGCGWDGVAVVGKGSKATLEDSRCIANLNHGLDVWDGGQAVLVKSRFQENSLTGIFVTDQESLVNLDNCSLERNREVGLVVANGAAAESVGSFMAENLLGGVFARDETTRLSLTGNKIEKNGEAGLVVGGGANLEKEEGNELLDNSGREKWLDADLTKLAEKPIIQAIPVEE